MGDRKRFGDYAADLVLVVGMGVTLYFLANNVLSSFAANLDPEKKKHDQARLKAHENLRRLLKSREDGHNGSGEGEDSEGNVRMSHLEGLKPEDLELNEYESMIALEVVPPQDISVGFNDIGGLEHIIDELREAVIYPLTIPELYAHSGPLLSPPSGVLLYGPPGCGKTMMAKALAHESGASFINLHISTLTEKWYGDSNKMVRAVFSLARKLQPAIIFIDEIDAVLGTRRSGEHEASGMVKAEFMTLWDGLTSSDKSGTPSRIVVLGATNRIHDIDEAILRRMPKKFTVTLPGLDQRRRILQLILGKTKRDESCDLEFVAKVTDGMSGSDIKEMCRDAAMMPMREYVREQHAKGRTPSRVNPAELRGIRTEDFFGRIQANMTDSATDTPASAGPVISAGDEMSQRRKAYRRQSGAKRPSKSATGGSSSKSRSNADAPADDNDEYEDIVDEKDRSEAVQ